MLTEPQARNLNENIISQPDICSHRNIRMKSKESKTITRPINLYVIPVFMVAALSAWFIGEQRRFLDAEAALIADLCSLGLSVVSLYFGIKIMKLAVNIVRSVFPLPLMHYKDTPKKWLVAVSISIIGVFSFYFCLFFAGFMFSQMLASLTALVFGNHSP